MDMDNSVVTAQGRGYNGTKQQWKKIQDYFFLKNRKHNTQEGSSTYNAADTHLIAHIISFNSY